LNCFTELRAFLELHDRGKTVLILEGNKLSGPLPSRLPGNLTYIDLHGNLLSGPIPAWQWAQDAPFLNVVLLHMNRLSGGWDF
jgi:hypothetical protein